MKRSALLLCVATLAVLSIGSGTAGRTTRGDVPAVLDGPAPWADSVLSTLSLDDRSAQLLKEPAFCHRASDFRRCTTSGHILDVHFKVVLGVYSATRNTKGPEFGALRIPVLGLSST